MENIIDKRLKYLPIKSVINYHIGELTVPPGSNEPNGSTLKPVKMGMILKGLGVKLAFENDQKIINLVFFLNIDKHLLRKTWNMIKKEHSNC